MVKIEWKQKYLKAFKMYLLGEDVSKIANSCEVTKLTIYRWVERNGWKDLQEKQIKELQEKVYSNVTDEKERSLKLIKAAESYWAKKLQNDEFDRINFSDLAQLQRAKWEILSPRTQTQYNFMKQENTINEPTYTLKIIKPNDNTNELGTEQEAI